MSKNKKRPQRTRLPKCFSALEPHLFSYVNRTNLPEGQPGHRARLRRWLDNIIAKRPPTAAFKMRAHLDFHFKSEGGEFVLPKQHSREIYSSYATMFALFLWEDSKLRTLLRRCPHCGDYFMATRAKQRFCGTTCRVANYRDSGRSATNQRRRRKAPSVRLRAKK